MNRRMNDTAQRKKQILDAAQQIFMKKGFYSASIDDVAAEVGVVRGTVLHYFKSKKELMEAVLERTGENIVPVLTGILENKEMPAKERIRVLLEVCRRQFTTVKPELMQYSIGQKDVEFRYLMDQMRIRIFYQMCEPLENVLKDGCNEGAFCIEDTHARANTVVFAIFGLTGADISADNIMQEMEKIVNALIFSNT